MKHLLLTTTLATFAFSGALYAQTPPAMPVIEAPAGFTQQDTQLTADTLLGATIYDSAGDSIGTVADLVFDLNATTAADTANAPNPARAAINSVGTTTHSDTHVTGGTAQEGMNVDALDGAEAEGLDGEAGEQVVPGTNDAVNGVGGGTAQAPATNAAAQDDAATNEANAGDVAPAGTAPADGNTQDATAQNANPDDPQVYGGTADQANTDVDGSDTNGDGTLDEAANAEAIMDTEMAPDGATDGTMAMSAEVAAAHEGIVPAEGAVEGAVEGAAAENAANTDMGGQITHAVLDVGGFLGMGQHRIAIPISDLNVYASGDEVRVYLPWTREQLEALPAYDAANPATLGTSPWTMAN